MKTMPVRYFETRNTTFLSYILYKEVFFMKVLFSYQSKETILSREIILFTSQASTTADYLRDV